MYVWHYYHCPNTQPPPKKKKITRTKGNKKQTAPKLQLSREKPDANT